MQQPPNAVQIELAQGCNLGCDFCGIHAIGYAKQQRGIDCMTLATAENIAGQVAELGWAARIEFAMHGEPTMNPQAADIVGIFRKHLPKAYLMLCSNGGGLLKNPTARIDALFNAGLNTLALDNYQAVNIVPKLIAGYTGNVPTLRYPDMPDANPHRRHRNQLISIVRDISIADDGTHSSLNNHAGSAAPLNDHAAGKRCAKPFREMSIRWDGNVAICCNDWPGVYHCGNVLRTSIGMVWQGAAFHAARQMLLLGRREFKPCQGCDAISYRVGLLPDKMGRETLPKPNKLTADRIAEALRGRPYTKGGAK